MKIKELLLKLDRAQQGLLFKVIASVLIVAVAVGVVVAVGVQRAAESQGADRARLMDVPVTSAPVDGQKPNEAEEKARRELVEAYNAQAKFFNRLIDQRFDTTSVAIGAGLAAVPLLAAVWLGIGLTTLGYLLLGAAFCYPLMRFGGPGLAGLGTYAAGVLALALSFSVLLQAVRLGLSASHPVTAIARNVLAEAVRMKVSLVFIVLLVLGLAALPGLLEPNTPLRYRVQSFMQYGSSVSYGVTAVLVLFLSAATVAFEQRDKVIWQTMTKPVRHWQYVLGKWLGVVSIAAVLLAVASTGVFLFTEYLRRTQTAVDETAPYVSAKGPGTISEDRLVLETQVMVGRRSARPLLPSDLAALIDREVQSRMVNQARLFKEDPESHEEPNLAKIAKQVNTDLLGEFLSVAPGTYKTFEFIGLGEARRFSAPLTVKYKVNAGANNPTDFYMVSFFVEDSPPMVRSVPLGQVLTIPLSNAAVRTREGKVGEEAQSLRLTIANGDVTTQRTNPQSINFAPDGLEVSYAVASFQQNYVRVALVMWLKLAFLAAVAVTTATFLAFPVACLVSFGTFALAESAGFLSQSLDYFSPDQDAGAASKVGHGIVSAVGRPLTQLFSSYADLSPVESLVEGRLIPWGTVAGAGGVLGLLCVVLLVVASVILRNRELATYSGQ